MDGLLVVANILAILDPKHYLVFALPTPTSTMALNPPPRKVYDFPELAIDNINKFAKGQGYAVATFRSKTDKQTHQLCERYGFSVLKAVPILAPLECAFLALA